MPSVARHLRHPQSQTQLQLQLQLQPQLPARPGPSLGLSPRAHLTAHPPLTHLASPPSARSPSRPAPSPYAHLFTVGGRGVWVCGTLHRMDAVAELTWTYLQRVSHTHTPRPSPAQHAHQGSGSGFGSGSGSGFGAGSGFGSQELLKLRIKTPPPPQPRKVRTEQKRGESPRPSGGTRTPVHLDCSGGYETSPLMFTFTGKYPCVRTSCSRWPAPSAEA